jgi:hypothetical protein
MLLSWGVERGKMLAYELVGGVALDALASCVPVRDDSLRVEVDAKRVQKGSQMKTPATRQRDITKSAPFELPGACCAIRAPELYGHRRTTEQRNEPVRHPA